MLIFMVDRQRTLCNEEHEKIVCFLRFVGLTLKLEK